MSFQQEQNPALNTITSCETDHLSINQIRYDQSVLISPEWIEPIKAHAIEHINQAIIAKIIELAPEVVLIGTGVQHLFIAPAQVASLYAAHIGVECMSSHAAARTYNVLMHEGRKVIAIILIG